MDLEDFKEVFNENLDILKIFEEVFHPSRWKLSKYEDEHSNDVLCPCLNSRDKQSIVPSPSDNQEN